MEEDRRRAGGGPCLAAATQPAENTLNKEGCNVDSGLSLLEVSTRQQAFGKNQIQLGEEESLVMKFFGQFKDPLILLLLASSAVSLLMGEKEDAFSITLAIVIVVTVAFVQEYRSDQAIEELTQLVPHRCRCIRETELTNLDATALVPGDIVRLSTGDRIPADIRLINVSQFQVDESSLTGETEPILKTSDALPELTEDSSVCHLTNVGFMGTLVCSGNATGIVVAIGCQTKLGQVFELMSETINPRSPLQIKMDELGQQLSLVSLAVIAVIAAVGVVQGRHLMDMFQVGVSLAVAAIPEGLPICVTVTLALGVMRMATKKAILKKLPAVEALGCASVVCVDKTGTLTKNEMTVSSVCCFGVPERIAVTGCGYDATNGHVMVNQTIANHLTCPALTRLLEIGVLCNNAVFGSNQKPIGQPTEIALLVAAAKLGLSDTRTTCKRKREISFQSDTKWMAVQCETTTAPQGPGTSQSSKDVYFVKGMTEKILSQCTGYSKTGRLDEVSILTDQDKSEIIRESQTMGSSGLRVLAFAWGGDIDHLCFAGLLGILDPPREDVGEAIAELNEADISVKMITGDAKHTAISIAKMLGIFDDENEDLAISGAELEDMSTEKLREVVSKVSVFYRTVPAHKLKIVQAFKENGQVVAMTGDGVNDAPALKAADIGIAMGLSGSDVSKEAADMILVDDRFATILEAVKEGKGIFFNIRNFLRFQLSTSVSALTLIALATCLGLPSPLNPMQILWINIIMDGPPAQSLGVEPVDDDVMLQPPRNPTEPIISRTVIKRVLTAAAWIVSGTLFVYSWGLKDGQITKRETTMTFTTFVFCDLFNALTCRSESQSVFRIGLLANKPFVVTVGCSLIAQLFVVYLPFFQQIFKTEPLLLSDLGLVTAIASALFVFDEVRKKLTREAKPLYVRVSQTEGIELV